MSQTNEVINLPEPFQDFEVMWIENHWQASPLQWRGFVRWKLGPLGFPVDGNDKAVIVQGIIEKLRSYGFPKPTVTR